jgi:hypothetical protein
MDKRIGWNLDSIEHAMFNDARPIPACANARSQVDPIPVKLLETAYIICNRILHMCASKRRSQCGIVILILLWATAIAPEPGARISISPSDLVRATTIGRTALIDLYLIERVNPNGRDVQGRTPLLIATSQQDWKTARRLIDAGALVGLADKSGFTPLMATAMHGNLEMFRALMTCLGNLHPEARCEDGRDLLGMALAGGNSEIIKTVTERLPLMPQWTTSTQHALYAALAEGNTNQIRLLLGKHSTPPTPEGKRVPLLAYAIVKNDAPLFSTLLTCGADANTVLPPRCDKDFLALLPSKSLRGYFEDDKNVTVLMLAAGLWCAIPCAPPQRRANRTRVTKRYKMSALDIAAETPRAFHTNASVAPFTGTIAHRNFSARSV